MIPGLGRSAGEGKGYPTPALWPGEFHGLYSPWGCKQPDTTERLSLCSSLVAQTVKSLPAMQETRVQSLGGEDPLEKEMATHSSILPWKIPQMEELGRVQSMGSQRVGHN